MALVYTSTSQKPTTVSHCDVGHFMSPKERVLALAFQTRLELHAVGQEGLQRRYECETFGKITALQFFRPKACNVDFLFVMFERGQAMTLKWDEEAGSAATVSCLEVGDDLRGRQTRWGNIAVIDPASRIVLMHLQSGVLKVVPLTPEGTFRTPKDLRLEEHEAVDICFCRTDGPGDSTIPIALLYEDRKKDRHVRTFGIKLEGNSAELVEGSIHQPHVEPTATMIIGVNRGGILVIGDVQITYIGQNASHKTITIKNFSTTEEGDMKVDEDIPEAAYMTASCRVGGTDKVLLGDVHGKLYVLTLLPEDKGQDIRMNLEAMGYTSTPSCLGWLGCNSMVYVGSNFGDPMLIRLLSSLNEEGTCIEVLETYPNIGPIIDLCVMEAGDGAGQEQVVTCSGGNVDGSLRIVRNGIGITELASLPDVTGVKGMWSLKQGLAAEHERYIVLSFVRGSKVLEIQTDELAEITIPGFEHNEATLVCCNVVDAQTQADYWLQATASGIRLTDPKSKQLVTKWNVAGPRITLATAGRHQVLCSSGARLMYLEIRGGKLVEVAAADVKNEIACLSLPTGTTAPATRCVLGLWNAISVLIVDLPTLEVRLEQKLGDTLPRSVLLHSYCEDRTPYLLCGLADGTVMLWEAHEDAQGRVALKGHKKISLGSQRVDLRPFVTTTSSSTLQPRTQQSAVFASSDRPTVIYLNGGKITFTTVNLKCVQCMSPFNTPELEEDNCLVLITDNTLMIGAVDGIQRLHIRTVPLNELPIQITYHATSKHLAVLTKSNVQAPSSSSMAVDNPDGDHLQYYIKLFASHSWECFYQFPLDTAEMGISMITMTFAEDPREYLVVGTAFVIPEEANAQNGRILVFRVEDDRLQLVTERECKGGVYSLNAFNGKLLSGVNSTLQLLKWQETGDGGRELSQECSHNGKIIIISIRSCGKYVFFSDLCCSVTLLEYRSLDSVLEEVAFDNGAMMTTTSEVLAPNAYITAEESGGLYTVAYCPNGNRTSLECVGFYNLGSMVNVLTKGSLSVAPEPEQGAAPNDPTAYMEDVPITFMGKGVLYGTVSGSIGVVRSLSREAFIFLTWVQGAMAQTVRSLGGVKFDDWREFRNDKSRRPLKGFIDGDLIEGFVDLTPQEQEQVVAAINADAAEHLKTLPENAATGIPSQRHLTVQRLIHIIDELSQLA